jgi:hypothetical protein
VEGVNNYIFIRLMKDLPNFCYLIGYQYSSISRVIFRLRILVRVCVIVILLILFNNILNDLINGDIEGLSITSTTARNNRDHSVKLLNSLT